ncbi:hypothetical protein EB796_012549 [Bugula neritina]|uniref:Uncharacterized protein n=1 Tax=Bugula neritina TaxID=10212 RepID=A0A7J7JS33_BUGNE|nr:hypothetical protein EB796_012549 [Bugula neritina]
MFFYRCSSPDSLYSSCRTNQSDLFITNQSALSFDNQSALSFTNQSEGNNYVATEELLNRDPLNSDVWTIYHHIFVLVGYVVVLKPITYLLVRFARKPHLS